MTSFDDFVAGFRGTVDSAAERLLALTDDEAAVRPAPGLRGGIWCGSGRGSIITSRM